MLALSLPFMEKDVGDADGAGKLRDVPEISG